MSLITRAAVLAAVRAWLVAESPSLTVIYAQQGAGRERSAPRPTPPYATVQVTSRGAVGQEHEYGWGTDPGKPAYVPRLLAGDRRIAVSVQVFGAGANDTAATCASGLSKETIRAALSSAGLAAEAVIPDVQDLTGLLDTDFEERAQFDVTFLAVDTYTESLPLIESVSGTITLDAPGDTDRVVINYDTADGP